MKFYFVVFFLFFFFCMGECVLVLSPRQKYLGVTIMRGKLIIRELVGVSILLFLFLNFHSYFQFKPLAVENTIIGKDRFYADVVCIYVCV